MVAWLSQPYTVRRFVAIVFLVVLCGLVAEVYYYRHLAQTHPTPTKPVPAHVEPV
jgi:hypothetical protein